jgi:hypothetical protein
LGKIPIFWVPTVSYFLTIGCQELLRTSRGSFPPELRGKCSRSFSRNFSKNQQLERTAPGFFPDPVDEVILKEGIGIINSQTSKASTLKTVRYLGAVCALGQWVGHLFRPGRSPSSDFGLQPGTWKDFILHMKKKPQNDVDLKIFC